MEIVLDFHPIVGGWQGSGSHGAGALATWVHFIVISLGRYYFQFLTAVGQSGMVMNHTKTRVAVWS